MRRPNVSKRLRPKWIGVGVLVLAVGASVALVTARPTLGSEPHPHVHELSADNQTSADELHSFIAVARRDIGLDINPLLGPDDAIRSSDLVVRGTIERIGEGPTIRFAEKPRLPGPNDSADDQIGLEEAIASYATSDVWVNMTTLWVRVSDVIHGDAVEVGSLVPVMIMRSPSVPIEEVLAVEFPAEALFILSDTTGWVPFDGAKVQWPDEVPSDLMLQPFADGAWLSNGTETHGVFFDPAEMSKWWGEENVSLDSLADQLRKAAARG